MKTSLPLAMTEESALIVEGSVSATLVMVLKTAVLRMIPYAIPGLALIAIDLIVGCQAARARGEQVRASTAIRRTLVKIFLYICFLILATTLAISFERSWLEWGTLGLLYANEFLSVVGNYLETKGIQFSIAGVYRAVVKWITGKVGVDVEPGDIIKPKRSSSRHSGKKCGVELPDAPIKNTLENENDKDNESD